MSTINDVAKLAGVSKSTVSHVFNRTKPTSDEIQERVYRAAEKLNYKRNYFAKTLAGKHSRVIGFRLDSGYELFDAFQHKVVEGILQACMARDYYLILMPYKNSRSDFFPVDGMILMNPSTKDNYLLSVPHVWLGKPLDLMKSPYYVDSNNESIIQDIIQMFLTYGRKSFLYLNCYRSKTVAHTRYQAFVNELVNYEYALDEVKKRHYFSSDCQNPAAFSAETFYSIYDELKPDAVIVDNDLMAQGIYRAAETLGISIPQELSIITISEVVSSSESFSPKLSSVDLNELELGRELANMLMDVIEKKQKDTKPRLVNAKLILRDSICEKPMMEV